MKVYKHIRSCRHITEVNETCKKVYTHVWSYINMYAFVSASMKLYRHVTDTCMKLYRHVIYTSMKLFKHVRRHIHMYEVICSCMKVYKHILSYTHINEGN